VPLVASDRGRFANRYASLYGACAEGLERGPDAFDGLMAILASRLAPSTQTPSAAADAREDAGIRDAPSAAARLWKASCAAEADAA